MIFLPFTVKAGNDGFKSSRWKAWLYLAVGCLKSNDIDKMSIEVRVIGSC